MPDSLGQQQPVRQSRLSVPRDLPVVGESLEDAAGPVPALHSPIGNQAVQHLARRGRMRFDPLGVVRGGISNQAIQRMISRSMVPHASLVIVQRDLDEAMDAARWPAPIQARFRSLQQNTGLEDDEMEDLVARTNPEEFSRLDQQLGTVALGILVLANLQWNEIRYYEQRLGADRVKWLCNVYERGMGARREHRQDQVWLLDNLRGEADQSMQGGRDPFRPNSVAATLRNTFPPPNVIEVVNGLIRINHNIDLQPKKVDELSPDDLGKIVAATRTLDDPLAALPAKETARGVLQHYAGSSVQRFRYDANAVAAKAFLDPLIPVGQRHAFDVMWNNASPRERFRAYDLKNAYTTTPGGAGGINRQAAAYAMRMNPATIPEFVNHFEFYYADFMVESRNIAEAYAAYVSSLMEGKKDSPVEVEPLSQQEAYERAAEDVLEGLVPHSRNAPRAYLNQIRGGNVPRDEALDFVADTYEDFRAGMAAIGVGPFQLNQGPLSPRSRGNEIRGQAQHLTFSSESSGAYHVRKHYGELPPDERTGHSAAQKVADFIASARLTIEEGTWTYQTGQLSGESHYFRRDRMRAIVIVNDTGQAFIATYMSG